MLPYVVPILDESSFTAEFLRAMNLYYGEFVYITSFIIYLIIVVFLLCNRQLIGSVRVELPLLLHSFQIFTLSGILLYLWFYPASDSALYNHIINALENGGCLVVVNFFNFFLSTIDQQ
ncbi:unnamed protein product [Angiostrongylus costaricensis]|uniref:Uncharacterized protein n=1 Tax=Angiostrongylus costaricensis TaxID=334426 RepID=A0A0R3Q2S7_ANGCS|nr:unnamed protein product [Angiostrongylus costaricensis]